MFESVIGLEIHVHIKTKTKLFCSCPVDLRSPPNVNICPICTGHPGVLPVLNRQAVLLAVRAGKILNSQISPRCVFARKNYFYPDLPKNYQISQYDLPLCKNGYLEINGKKIGIERLHMEEDAGRLVHTDFESYVDFTRSGVPLLEIVTKPDMSSPVEAYEFMKKLHKILVWTDVTEGSMEEGNFRCDVNVSVRPVGQKELGTKVELKNINSFKFVKEALEYEIKRQKSLLESGGNVIQETRLFDPAVGKTYTMRTKEEAHDYRYFPEPDLLPLVIDENILERAEEGIPELPDSMRKRFTEEYNISEYSASVLTDSLFLADFFERCAKKYKDYKKLSNFILENYLRFSGEERLNITEDMVVSVLIAQDEGKLTRNLSKDVFMYMVENKKDIDEAVKALGVSVVQDESLIFDSINSVLKEFPSELRRYKSGEKKLFGFFMGEAMKKLGRRGDPKKLKEILEKKLME